MGSVASNNSCKFVQVKDSDHRERQPLLLRTRKACAQLGRPWPQRRWRHILGALLAAGALLLLLPWVGQAPGLGREAALSGLLRSMGGEAALREEGQRWLAERGLALRPSGAPLGVCILTADFWGLKSAGGTATAYHLLAQVRRGLKILTCLPTGCEWPAEGAAVLQALGGAPNIHVTFLGVTKRANECQEGARIHSHSPDHVTFACLEAQHFLPEARLHAACCPLPSCFCWACVDTWRPRAGY